MAGAGYKLFNTGDVLTAAQVNTYLQEQVVMVFASATARTTALTGVLAEGMMSYLQDTNAVEVYDGSAWVSVGSTGDITGVTAGTGISGGGTTGTVTITNDMATTITASGDIVVGTGSGTYDNLPIGTTGQVLTADTTVSPYKVKWATASSGGMTLINTGGTTLTGSSVSIGSIPATYKNLQLIIRDYKPATDGTNLWMRFNNDSTANRYTQEKNGTYTDAAFDQPQITIIRAQDNGTDAGLAVVDVFDYANTTTWKLCNYVSLANNTTNTGNFNAFESFGAWNQTSAINEINLIPASGNFTSGTAYLYGVA